MAATKAMEQHIASSKIKLDAVESRRDAMCAELETALKSREHLELVVGVTATFLETHDEMGDRIMDSKMELKAQHASYAQGLKVTEAETEKKKTEYAEIKAESTTLSRMLKPQLEHLKPLRIKAAAMLGKVAGTTKNMNIDAERNRGAAGNGVHVQTTTESFDRERKRERRSPDMNSLPQVEGAWIDSPTGVERTICQSGVVLSASMDDLTLTS